MNSIEGTGENLCAIYVDMGTTNTRVWLLRGSRVLARAGKLIGVRDAARDGSRARIQAALGELIATVRAQATASSVSCKPECVAAAGMITSPLGLAELPHIPAPAGIGELAAASRWFEFPEITDLPLLLIPGVRSGPASVGIDHIDTLDVCRGEETLCVGLKALNLAGPTVVLNLGSHWKAIQLDDRGRIASSVTSLSGELIHAAQTQTILASSVLKERPGKVAGEWMEAGMREQRRSGIGRALFCVRLLELVGEGTTEERLAFLIGVFIASDLDGLIARKVLAEGAQVVIAGSAAVAEAWQSVLAQMSVPAVVLTDAEVEEAWLAGIRSVLAQSYQSRNLRPE